MSKDDEQILVIGRQSLFDGESITFQGFASGELIVTTMLEQLHNFYEVRRRGDMETNPLFKQPIPYVVLRCGDEVFTYQRLIGGGEEKLHGRISIGVGGHMNEIVSASSFAFQIQQNMHRELDEEVEFDKNGSTWYVLGFINDDSDDVGRVHVGVLVIYEIEATDVKVREEGSMLGNWRSLDELSKPEVYLQLENWSKIAVDALK